MNSFVLSLGCRSMRYLPRITCSVYRKRRDKEMRKYRNKDASLDSGAAGLFHLRRRLCGLGPRLQQILAERSAGGQREGGGVPIRSGGTCGWSGGGRWCDIRPTIKQNTLYKMRGGVEHAVNVSLWLCGRSLQVYCFNLSSCHLFEVCCFSSPLFTAYLCLVCN